MQIEEVKNFAKSENKSNNNGNNDDDDGGDHSNNQNEAAAAGEGSQLLNNRGPRNPLTKAMIVEACLKNGFYRTPSCNERLYLHFKGLDSLGGDALAEYTEALCAWLEGNCLTSLEGIAHLPKLRCLYAHQNMLEKLDHLETLTNLDAINVSDNYIRTLSGLDSQAECLSTLQIKNNKLRDRSDYEHVTVLQSLRTLDVSGNDIQNGQDLLEVLAKLPNLKALYLSGNPFVREMRNFRKTVLAALPGLLHLDDKPVFPDERRLVTAWARGGMDAEREERKKLREEEVQEAKQRLEDFRKLVKSARDEQQNQEGEQQQQQQNGDAVVGSSGSESEVDSTPTTDSDESENKNGGVNISAGINNRRGAAAARVLTSNATTAQHVDAAASLAQPAPQQQPEAETAEDLDDVFIPQ